MKTFTFISILSLSASLAISAPIKLKSSDILKNAVQESTQAYEAQNNQAVELSAQGSISIVQELKDGKCDIAIIALPDNLKEELKAIDNLKISPLAYQGVVVSVNEANPIKELSLKDLNLMYFANGNKFAKKWRDFGINNDSSIRALTPSFNDKLVVNLFKKELSPTENLASWVGVMNKEEAIIAALKTGSSAIAISAQPLNGTKELPIVSTKTNFAYFASPESLFNDEYPLKMTFYLVFNKEKTVELKDFVKFLYTKTGSEPFKNAGFYLTPEKFQKNFILELDIL